MKKAKTSPVTTHADEDSAEARDALLAIARNPDTKPKDKVEAWKLLMRIHKKLSPEKVVQKPQGQKKEESPLTKKQKERLDELFPKRT